MIARLQETVEWQHETSTEQLKQEHQRSMEQQQKQYQELQQLFNNSLDQQQQKQCQETLDHQRTELAELREKLAKYEKRMYDYSKYSIV